MPILIKTQSTLRNEEWVIAELQGDLEVRSLEKLHDQFIGDLNFNKYGQPILIIGHHILQGREQKLDKPFAVLEKSRTSEGDQILNETTNLSTSLLSQTCDRTVLDNTITLENKSRQRTEYTVLGVCTKKLIFKARPKPIIGNMVVNM